MYWMPLTFLCEPFYLPVGENGDSGLVLVIFTSSLHVIDLVCYLHILNLY
jgi:hypothetical protein